MDSRGGGTVPKGEDSLESGGSADQGHHDSSPAQHSRHRIDVTSASVKITLLLVTIGVSYILLNQSSFPYKLFQSSYSISSSYNHTEQRKSCIQVTSGQDDLSAYTEEEIRELQSTLKKAAMADEKTVIITTLNAAWSEPNSIFDIFLESFRIGNQTQKLLKHVVVAALDETAYSRCVALNLHCFYLTTADVNFSAEAHFMSEDYLKMMWRRIDFLRVVLQLGYDFVFSDADVMWLRDPFTRFYPTADFQIACDHYWFNSTDLGNSPNGGFNYVKSSNKTIRLYKFWYNGRDYFPGKHDQDVLNMIKADPYVTKLEMDMRFLDTAYFGGFCEPSKDLDLVVTMHANCCIGMENKIHDMQMVIDDWKRYMALPSGVEKNLSSRSWTVPRRCY